MRASELPAIYLAADQVSTRSQRNYLRLRRFELLSLALAAIAFEVYFVRGRVNVSALVGFILLVVAVFARLAAGYLRLESTWYDARAAAESIKTLAWQYTVAGSAFPLSMLPAEATEQLIDEIRQVIETDAKGLDVPAGANGSQITSKMRSLRQAPLRTRRQQYLSDRVDDQQAWYSSKSDSNRELAHKWTAAILATEVLAALLALLLVLNVSTVNVSGVLAALGASAIAWTQIRQHSSLAEAYAVTSHDVGLLREPLVQSLTEDEWAEAVHDAEAAFSREHTLWRARRQRK